jgi:hypothetical protein
MRDIVLLALGAAMGRLCQLFARWARPPLNRLGRRAADRTFEWWAERREHS